VTRATAAPTFPERGCSLRSVPSGVPVGDLPLVSIAIPLYCSAPWVQNILVNIANIDYPNVEIIISDRHCADDALNALEKRLCEDPRVTFMRATDGLNWVAHYNLLLASAGGNYFLWMPHDDHYPSGYVERLVAALEADPDAVLAYGGMECERPGQIPPALRQLRLPSYGSRAWSPRDASCLIARGNQAGVAFRGIFRRARVVACGLYVRPAMGLVMADEYWLLALALLGPFRFVPSCSCRKRFYPGSAHSRWRYTFRVRLNGLQMVHSYLRDYCPSRKNRILVILGFSFWTLRRLLDPIRDLARK
jgi:glycosyltransferase involved in cell wall biosynthesis